MKKAFDYIVAISGLLLLGVGLALLKLIANPQGVMLTLPYICIGVGCGMFRPWTGQRGEQQGCKKQSRA